jgi:hypothetical protein
MKTIMKQIEKMGLQNAIRPDKQGNMVDHESKQDGYWVFLRPGFICLDMDCQTIHEYTVSEVIDRLKSVTVSWESMAE